MNEREQARIIDRAHTIELPLNREISLLSVPTIFSTRPGQLSFHALELEKNDVLWLVPEVIYYESNDYRQAIIVKKDSQSLVALCVGEDKRYTVYQPVATFFNLTEPGSLQVMVTSGGRVREVENNDRPRSGGISVSRLMHGNPKRTVAEITADESALNISIIDHYSAK